MNMNDLFKSVFYKLNFSVHKIDKSVDDISKNVIGSKPHCMLMYNDKIHEELRNALKYKDYAPRVKDEHFKYTGIYWVYAEKKYKYKHYSELQLKHFLDEELPKEECIQSIAKSNYKYKNMSHIITCFSRNSMGVYIHSGVELNRETAKTIALRFFEAFLSECLKYMNKDDNDYPYVYHIYPHGEYHTDIFVLGKNDINYQVSIDGKTHDIDQDGYIVDEWWDKRFHCEDTEILKNNIEKAKKKFNLTEYIRG